MTFNEDLNSDLSSDFPEESNYPVAFGITFTPQVSGIAFGLLGLAGAAYILFNFVLPAYDSYQTLKNDEASKQEKVDSQKSGAISKQLAAAEDRLRESEFLRSQVLGQFSSRNNLQTLLYDIAQLAKAKGVILNSYAPQGDLVVINDNSFGNTVNKKLKRQTFTLDIQGSYPQINAFITDLEKLQPLLIISGLKMNFDKSSFTVNLVDLKLQNGNVVSKGKIIPTQSEIIKANFNLEAILPLSPEELAKLAQSEQKDKQKSSPSDSKPPPAEK